MYLWGLGGLNMKKLRRNKMKKENKLDTFEVKEQKIIGEIRSLLKISKTMKIEIEHAIAYKDLYSAKIYIMKNEHVAFEFHVIKNSIGKYCFHYIETFPESFGMKNCMSTITNMYKNSKDIFILLKEYISLFLREEDR